MCVNQCHFGVNQNSRRHFTTSFCKNGVVLKTSPRNSEDLAFSGITKGLSYDEFVTNMSNSSLAK